MQTRKKKSQHKDTKQIFQKCRKVGILGYNTNYTLIHDQIMSRLNMEKVYYYTTQNPFSFNLPSKNIKIKLHKTITLTSFIWESKMVSYIERKMPRKIS
jgi:hypothetical protein